MILRVLFAAFLLLPLPSGAVTKNLECKQITDKGVEQMVFATLDDSAYKAEVDSFALSADCAKERSCGVKIYDKEVLPSVIRLTNILRVGGEASYTTVTDIDCSTLSVTTRTKFISSVGRNETKAIGSCTVKVDNIDKVL
ncbi:hypothetical protein [Xanthomonas arboricola]|uniref:hypothetical protein n=1 Tax=Xanthomonas arboricola TaxID=56448 RepID=UPI0011B04253|nr:hypothetical protein [Xanthomonas arboricola]